MSGGRATVHGVVVRQAGDIVAVAEEGLPLTDRYVFEVKHHRDFNLDRFILENKGKLAGFWKVHCTLAKKWRRKPILIAKRNGYPPFVVTGTLEKPRVLLFSSFLKQPPPGTPNLSKLKATIS